VRRTGIAHEAVLSDDFSQVLPAPVDEDARTGEIVTDVYAGARMELAIDFVRDVLPLTVEQELHAGSPPIVLDAAASRGFRRTSRAPRQQLLAEPVLGRLSGRPDAPILSRRKAAAESRAAGSS
jgi:hypothetical protein